MDSGPCPGSSPGPAPRRHGVGIPATAGGFTFLSLEDETGLINVVVLAGCRQRYRKAAGNAPALLVRGRLDRSEGVINVVADKLEARPISRAPASGDFR